MVRRIKKRIASECFTLLIVALFVLKYKRALVAQRIEQTRPKGEMEVQFPPRAPETSSSAERSVRDREVEGSIPSSPTKGDGRRGPRGRGFNSLHPDKINKAYF